MPANADNLVHDCCCFIGTLDAVTPKIGNTLLVQAGDRNMKDPVEVLPFTGCSAVFGRSADENRADDEFAI